ncbi:MAG: S-layer homology domain-containing protein, partial [Lutispora sp.]|nr:S-layer homology domain-containing protein [Lutispora sp.]
NATNKNVIWTSSNNSIATVSSNGIVKGLNAGLANIIVTTIDGNKTANCTIEVKSKSSGGGNTGGSGKSYAGGGSGVGSSTNDNIEKEKQVITEGLIKFGKTNLILNTETRILTGQLDERDLKLAEFKDSTNINENSDITIEFENISNINGYVLHLSISILNKETANRRIIIKTDFGNMTIPNSILDSDFAGDNEYIDIFITKLESKEVSEDIKKLIGNRVIFNLGFMVNGVAKSWSNPNIPIKVSLKYEPAEEELKNSDNIVVYYIDEFGKANVVSNGKFDPTTNQITFYTTHLSKYAIAYIKIDYTDLEKTKWAEKEINAMSGKGIIRSDGNKKFEPQKNITRAEFIYGLIKAIGFTSKVEGNFNDINITDYYYDEIAIARKLGISDGIGNNYFHPLEYITRQDMMILITRALKIDGKLKDANNIDLGKFKDSNLIAPYAKESVCTVVDKGIIIGDGEYIKPLNNATRAETAIILYRIYNGI